ncbi:MAG: glycosyltransferase family 4 protein [Tepidisphaeraceae bacterium]
MRIGFMMDALAAIGTPGNGVRAQARHQADALTRLGHSIERLNPWLDNDTKGLDLVQFFVGGNPFIWIETLKYRLNFLVFAPMIDSNEPHWRYRIAARLGRLTKNRFITAQGLVQQQAETADLVIVRSTHERERLTQSLGIDDAKIEMVLNGANPPTPATGDLAREKLGLPERYVAHVSNYGHGRKNVPMLIEACGELGYPLIVAGSREPGPPLQAAEAAAKKYPGLVKLHGFLDADVLQSLYAGARVFALPSVNEGTGLVAVEAAAQGAAVVITKNGGPPDYFLNMAEYVDPFDKQSVKSALQRAWEKGPDPRLKQHVLTNLTWDNSARQLDAAYKKHMRTLK